VSGEAGQVFTVTVSDDGDDSYPYLQLVTTGGAVLATSDGGPLLAALLPQEGDYLLLPRDVADSGATTMTASVVDIAITPESASQVGSSTLHSLARGKAIDQALNFYRWGTTGQDVGFTPDAIFDLCWFGVLDGAADQVLDICEGLVASPGTTDPYSIARYRDARGLARALNGNTAGALEDFAYYAGQGGSYAAQRQEWVDRLRDGEAVSNVLNAEMLQSLLTQY
jgi:hypothetical protein